MNPIDPIHAPVFDNPEQTLTENCAKYNQFIDLSRLH